MSGHNDLLPVSLSPPLSLFGLGDLVRAEEGSASAS